MTHYKFSCYTRTNTLKTRRKYTIGKHLSRFFSKKDRLILLLGLGGKLEGRFKICYKQILNHVANFCNLYFQISLPHFQANCKTFFHILLHYFLLSVKKKITVNFAKIYCNHFDFCYYKYIEGKQLNTRPDDSNRQFDRRSLTT